MSGLDGVLRILEFASYIFFFIKMIWNAVVLGSSLIGFEGTVFLLIPLAIRFVAIFYKYTTVISSGKTLINAMIVYIKNAYGPGSSEYSEFKTTYLKKEYDDSFGYRFLTRLRDFSQHGHLPVSMMKTERGNVAWFDIDRILKTPHFHHNETIAANLEELRESILKDFGSTARIAFAFTIAQYNLSVVTIYSSFYGSVKDDFFRICDKVDNHLIEYPEAIIKADGYPNGMVGYLDDDDTSHLHIFNPEDKTREMFVGFSEKANITLQKDTEEMELLKLSFKFPAK